VIGSIRAKCVKSTSVVKIARPSLAATAQIKKSAAAGWFALRFRRRNASGHMGVSINTLMVCAVGFL
jgi:hypothetical protein